MSGKFQWLKPFMPTWLRPRNTLGRQVLRRTGTRVFAGPFRGINYPAVNGVAERKASVFFPYLLGTYEFELHPVVEEAIALAPDLVVNVGAGEGYYAVGMAVRCPHAKIVAFEIEERTRSALAEMAAANGVQDRIEIQGRCSPESLADVLQTGRRTVVICDVEGYEDVLLDPARLPALKAAWILVELHEGFVPGVTARLKERFHTTHAIHHFVEQPRTREHYPFQNWLTRILPDFYVTFMVQEHRPETMSWLWMTPGVRADL